MITQNKRPIGDCPHTETHFVLDNGLCSVKINRVTGLIDEFKVDGEDYINRGGVKLTAYKDNEDPWGMTVDGFYQKKGDFILLSKHEVNAFNGYPEENFENVRIIENGNVRTKIQATFGYNKSFAVITYTVPKNEAYVDIDLKLIANDVNTMYKLKFDTTVDGEFIGQSVFGREEMLKDSKEVCFQKWCALVSGEKSFAVINKSTYGGSADKNVMNLSVMRTPVYSAHPIMERNITEHDRWNEHIDFGENDFSFRICADMTYIDSKAEIFNNEPYVMSFFPPISEKYNTKTVSVDSKDIILTRFSSLDGDILVRLFNSSSKEITAVINTQECSYCVKFAAYEIKTFKLSNFAEREFI